MFQLAIGGGEPLARKDLPATAARASGLGLVVHVSTGQWRIPASRLAELAAGVTALQIGVPPERLLRGVPEDLASLRTLVEQAGAAGLRVGANLILSRTALAGFGMVMRQLRDAGFGNVTILRYKPPPSIERWITEAPSEEDWREFEAALPAVVEQYPGMPLRVDCALSFLQRHLPPAHARAAGIRGCVAGQRILAVAPDGTAYPCSQLVRAAFSAGSLLNQKPGELWRSPVLKRSRAFRDEPRFRETQCGVCLARPQCGGCRVFAQDGLMEDPGCSGPVLPPLTMLGKHGCRWDVRQYVEESREECVDEDP